MRHFSSLLQNMATILLSSSHICYKFDLLDSAFTHKFLLHCALPGYMLTSSLKTDDSYNQIAF